MVKITSEIFAAYLDCPLKSFKLLQANEIGVEHEYIRILKRQKNENYQNFLFHLKQEGREVLAYHIERFKQHKECLHDTIISADDLEARCDLLIKNDPATSREKIDYEPTIFIGTNHISKKQKLGLGFVGYVLQITTNLLPSSGRIIAKDCKIHRVKFEKSQKQIVSILENIREWIVDSSLKSPPLILNKHCPYCQFQNACKSLAEQTDNISLLSSISTLKALKAYEKKGIFTVKQLSYLSQPRRRRRIKKSRSVSVHKPDLQALAIRTEKVYVQDLPELSRKETEIFFDIEGIPDDNAYYLIGIIVKNKNDETYYSFWADTLEEEETILNQCVELFNQYPEAPIYHYGNYDEKAIQCLAQRYDIEIENIKKRFVNLTSFVYGKIYFPLPSNSLKDIGKYLGVSWSTPNASGLQSLIWRYHWDQEKTVKYKERLLTYNQEDCLAVRVLADELTKIQNSADILNEIDFINQPKGPTTKVSQETYSQLNTVLEFAQTKYKKQKISFRKALKDEQVKKVARKTGYQGQRKVRPKPTKALLLNHPEYCPVHKKNFLRSTKTVKRLIIDLVLMKNGVKKTITEFEAFLGYCAQCKKVYYPEEIISYKQNTLYGRGLKAWFVYNRVMHKLTYESILTLRWDSVTTGYFS